MSETVTNAAPAVPKQRPAHLFKPGQSGNPAGRARGSRNRLADSFVADLRDCWERNGPAALEACATKDPSTFVRVIASLLPKTLDLNIQVDMQSTLNQFRDAVRLLHNEPKVIDARPNRP